jgi:DHA3 family macrolide efflux protein-like MFS transporter
MDFSLIAFFSTIPAIVVAPFIGPLVDRVDKRNLILCSNTGYGLCTAVILALSLTGHLRIWHIYIAIVPASLFSFTTTLSQTSAISLLVPAKFYTQVTGLMTMGTSIVSVIAPGISGLLLQQIGLSGAILIEICTVLIDITILWFLKFPDQLQSTLREQSTSFWKEALEGWKYILYRPGMIALLLLFGVTNLFIGFISILLTPFVLSFGTTSDLGFVTSVCALGTFLGGITVAIRKTYISRIRSIILFMFLEAFATFMGVIRPNVYLLGGAAIVFTMCSSMINCHNEVIWRNKVPKELQGRVFSLERMVTMATLPIAYLLAGPLIDHIFDPLFLSYGKAENFLGVVLGTGPGRGIALFFIILSIFLAVSSLIGYGNPRLRNLEKELPDATTDLLPQFRD